MISMQDVRFKQMQASIQSTQISSTKYSEDGKYTFTKNEDGTYKWHLVDDELLGTSIDEIANWAATGTPNRNIEARYLHYLRKIDPELYEATQNIGREVRNYNLLTECYKSCR